jgi:protein-tyrosine phosphatase
MIPLVDLHCHLLAGLDDGPATAEDALAMCRLAHTDGVRNVAAVAHQNSRWPDVTPALIREATQRLAEQLRSADIPLCVHASAEVMVELGIEARWEAARIMTVADLGRHVLIEMPHGLMLDLRGVASWLREENVRPILAHPERCPGLLDDADMMTDLIRLGCLVQVSSGSVTDPPSRSFARALRAWFRGGFVHLLGSDGHSPRRRPPLMSAAYHQICRWVGPADADRICSTNGLLVLQGLPLRVPQPQPPRRSWIGAWW